MNSSIPHRGAAHAASTPMPHDGQLVRTTEGPHDFRLTVEFPTRLNLGSVAIVRVEVVPLEPVESVMNLGPDTLAETLPVRLVVPGAVVMPTEQVLSLSPFGPTWVAFHLTPLAAGPLPGARLEVLRQGHIDSIELPLRGQGRSLSRAMLAFTVLVPLLLHVPALCSGWVGAGGVARALRGWLPGGAVGEMIANQAQRGIEFLATSGHDLHFSFTSLGLMLAACAAVQAWCRPRRGSRAGASFRAGGPPKSSANTPDYLTPVSAPEFHTFRPPA